MCGVMVAAVSPCGIVVAITVIALRVIVVAVIMLQRMAESSTTMLMVIQQLGSTRTLAVCILCSTRRLIVLTLEKGKGSLVHCQQPFPVTAARLVVIIFRLNVTVEDFVLMHDAVDVSQFLGLSGELKHDLKP